MPTYVYEVLDAGGRPVTPRETFELSQSIKDQPLTRHPQTGMPVRRVIQGFSILGSGSGAPEPGAGRGGGPCGPSCGCHH